MLRQEGHSNSQVIQTQTTSAVVLLPDSGFYIIEVRAVSEGGDGTASSQIRVPSYSGNQHVLSYDVSMMLNIARPGTRVQRSYSFYHIVKISQLTPSYWMHSGP